MGDLMHDFPRIVARSNSRSFLFFAVILLLFRISFEDQNVQDYSHFANATFDITSCHNWKRRNSRQRVKTELERRYRSQHSTMKLSEELFRDKNKVTLVFGHVHHAGGTAICQLARNNTLTNPKNNCNHPLEFKGLDAAPTRSSIKRQLAFQHQSPWLFYMVELMMPRHMKFSGPFIFGAVLRNPYLLLMSQFRRAKARFQFSGDLIDLVHLQLKYVGITDVNFRSHMPDGALPSRSDIYGHEPRNYFRGQAGFILGRFGPTNATDSFILNMAKRRLNRFSVVALTEFMVESGIVLSSKLDWKVFDFGHKVINSNGASELLVAELMSLSQRDREFVSFFCRIDIMLYYHAKCLLEKEYKLITNQSMREYSYRKLDAYFQDLEHFNT